jgi:hypothetical protein
MEKERIIAHLNFWPVIGMGLVFLVCWLVLGLLFGFTFPPSAGSGFEGFENIFLFLAILTLIFAIPGFFMLMKWKHGWWATGIIFIVFVILMILGAKFGFID